ncbi:MAG TPA: MFS transporter [Ilumatobacteraceae bacterium]|nr:MFS transporter [Ilumatobacteraceae bacterium]
MPDQDRGASTLTIVGIALASALVPLNSTMIAVALPTLADEFDITKGHAAILITVYLVAMLVGQPTAGRVADHVGARRLALVAIAGFGACSAAAMFAGTFAVLVAVRAGQAVFASALSPSVQALLRKVTDSDSRGRAFGLQGSVIGVGAGLGPALGGLLLAGFGWRALFAVNLPIVVVVLIVLSRSVPDTVDRRDARSTPESEATSADDPSVTETPLANSTFVAAFSTQTLTVLAQYALLLIAPMLLDDRGWSSGEVGFAVTALTLGMIVMSPIGGRLGDEWGRRRPVMLGLAAATVAVAASAAFGTDVASALLIATLLGFGLGYGIASPSILTAGIEAAPEDRVGLAAGLLSMSRYVGSIIASVLLTIIVTDDAEGVGTMLVLSTVALGISLVTASRLPRLPIANDDLVTVA